MIRALIADDEPVARQTLRVLLDAEPAVEIVGECADGLAAIEAIRRQQPDLVFLDVRMPGASGFDVLAAAGRRGMAVVFTTAFDQYAVEAFRAEAFDYLLKPFDNERFQQTMRRICERLEERDYSLVGQQLAGAFGLAPERYLTRLLVRERGRVAVLAVDRIDWVAAAGNYVEVHMEGRAYLVRQTMRDFERQLDPTRFARVHRSAIVNLDRVRELRPHSHGEAKAVLDSGVELPVSRIRRLALHRALARASAAATHR